MSYERVTQLRTRIIIGSKQTLKAMHNEEVSEVFIANDADQHVTESVVKLAEKLVIPYTVVDSKKKLGIACNIEVDAATVAIKSD